MSPVTYNDYFSPTPVSIYWSNPNYSNFRYSQRKVETKKERVKRIATEKMLASYRLFNQKTERVIQVIQNAKPQHRIYNFKR